MPYDIRIFHLYDQHGNSIMGVTAPNVPANNIEDFANAYHNNAENINVDTLQCCDISSFSWQNPFRTFSKDLLKNELEDFSWTDKIMMIGHWPSHIFVIFGGVVTKMHYLNIPILLRHQTYFRTISTNLWNRILKLFLTLVKKPTDVFWADWLKYIIVPFFLSQGLMKPRRRWDKEETIVE